MTFLSVLLLIFAEGPEKIQNVKSFITVIPNPNFRRNPDGLSSAVIHSGERGGTWVFFGWVCASLDSKLAEGLKP